MADGERRGRGVVRGILQITLGLVAGLGLAEAAFFVRDDGAFPHLNIYEADPEYGVRLRANDTTRVRVATNPAHDVRTNDLGFRGAPWPDPEDDDILIVGDSQVFGLGVPEADGFGAQLATLRGATVLNVGTPTWGPPEFTRVVAEVLERRQPAHVVYVFNLANDLFEVERPNLDRHAVWDGWAVRKETAPADAGGWPGQQWLMSRSHLVFAARRWWYGDRRSEGVAISEGTWQDIVAAGQEPRPPTTDQIVAERLAARTAVDAELKEVGDDVMFRFSNLAKYDRDVDLETFDSRGAGNPRDILFGRAAEAARPVPETAYQLLRAAVASDDNDAVLRRMAAQADPKLTALLDRRAELRKRLDGLPSPENPSTDGAAPLDALLARTQDLTREAGATLLVVALPLDVMVSADEWAKYGAEPIDMTATRGLVEDLVKRARGLGIRTLDATPALAAAEPGAFLDGDLHLTAKGHAALAAAISDALDAPAPTPLLTLPEGRSWPPTEDEWSRTSEIVVRGSTAAGCQTRRIREWFRADCSGIDVGYHERPEILSLSGGHGDAWIVGGRGHAYQLTVVMPVLPGDDSTVTLRWYDTRRTLSLAWPEGAEKPKFAFSAPRPMPPRRSDRMLRSPVLPPTALPGVPWCGEGQANFGVLQRCATPCEPSDAEACGDGVCEPWFDGGFCVEPV